MNYYDIVKKILKFKKEKCVEKIISKIIYFFLKKK